MTRALFKFLKIDKYVPTQREQVSPRHHGGPAVSTAPNHAALGLQQLLHEKGLSRKGKVICFQNEARGFSCSVGNRNHLMFGFNFLREEKRKGKQRPC